MKTLLILPLIYLVVGSPVGNRQPFGEIIINNIPSWSPVTVSGKYKAEINMPELTSDFIAGNKIKVAVKFRKTEGFQALPYFDNQSAGPGIYDYEISPLKLTITFSPRSAGGSNGSSILPMEQISFNYTSITFE
jgi:hypothetical protein